MNSKQDSPWHRQQALTVAFKKKKTQKISSKTHQKHLKNLEKLTLRTERLKRERELKSTESGRRFHAFTIRSQKKFARVRELTYLLIYLAVDL